MPDNKTLTSEALRAIKISYSYAKTAKETADKLQKYFRNKNVELTVVNTDIDAGKKDSADYERQLAAAEKTLATLTKAKADPATAKKLDAAVKDAAAALKALRTNLATYEKFADQAEKDDAKLDQVAAQLLKLGAPTLQTLKEAVIVVQDHPQAVQEGFDKGWPKQAIQKAFVQVGTDIHAVGEMMAKGEIFSKSADTLLDRRKDAFERTRSPRAASSTR